MGRPASRSQDRRNRPTLSQERPTTEITLTRTLIARILLLTSAAILISFGCAAEFIDIPAATVQDKIRGGLLGHLLGDLNGLAHEMKYIAEPGNVTTYTPSLPKGAWTDDDTDFEWVYVVAMQHRKQLLLPPAEIVALWKAHINRYFWCANQYARQLMDLGLEPPLTGYIQFNPWSDFNISGQFVCESFGLISPAMPATAARIGVHYTQTAISGEPAQTTQLFDAMIATAFLTNNITHIIRSGLAAVDYQRTVVHQVVSDVLAWHRQNPNDWRATRRLVKEKYSHHNGAMRDRNGYELNTASAIAALLYGEGDYIKTSIAAFNFGWDADNNAATACTIIGVLKGAKWMLSQGWDINDVYRNTTRDNMPTNETITTFGDRLIALAEQVILEHGGQKILHQGVPSYRITLEQPQNLAGLFDQGLNFAKMRAGMRTEIENALFTGETDQTLARGAYLAICLDLAPQLQNKNPAAWNKAIKSLQSFEKLVGVLFFESPTPAGESLRKRALDAGLKKPEKKPKIW